MISEVILPKLGQTMEEGAIVDWVKEEGEPGRFLLEAKRVLIPQRSELSGCESVRSRVRNDKK